MPGDLTRGSTDPFRRASLAYAGGDREVMRQIGNNHPWKNN
jgi:hypothetical protein